MGLIEMYAVIVILSLNNMLRSLERDNAPCNSYGRDNLDEIIYYMIIMSGGVEMKDYYHIKHTYTQAGLII